jgi:Uma2 family endonuclease
MPGSQHSGTAGTASPSLSDALPDSGCVLNAAHPDEPIITHPPFICFEILSKCDRISAMFQRVQDYLKFGVPYVWILDLAQRKAYRCLPHEFIEELSNVLATENPAVTVKLNDVFVP